jgi:putative hydroxymethylpyrimidine transport system substrate-binding protein
MLVHRRTVGRKGATPGGWRLPLALLIGLACAGQASAADKLTVLLDWFVNPNHGPLIVAQEIGAFQRHGLDVTLVQPADPTLPPRLVAAGQGDIAVDYQPQLYLQVTGGLPLMRIGVLIDHDMQTLATLKGDGISRIADLRGKRIGWSRSSPAPTWAQMT